MSTTGRGTLVLGTSTVMQDLNERIDEIAPTRMSVLILGPSGAGKQRVAAAIHERSGRKGQFVEVNCAALTEATAESELFGHVAGAFTDAKHPRKGLIRSADTGTLFLDEFADLPRAVQMKLLRVFEDPRIVPMGADAAARVTVNVRFVAATSQDTEALMRGGALRRDLVNRFEDTLIVPGLVEHPEDIAGLAQHFVELHRGDDGLNPHAREISSGALRLLASYEWPRNVRELESAVKKALRRSTSTMCAVLDVEHFRLETRHVAAEARDPVRDAVREIGRQIFEALEAGRLPRRSIEELSRDLVFTPLKLELVQLFEEQYDGADKDQAADRLFGYVNADCVRRIRRQHAKVAPRPPDEG